MASPKRNQARLVRLDPDVAELFPTDEAVNTALRSFAKRRRVTSSVSRVEVRRGPIGKPAFERYIGIDYSGAEHPGASLKGLRVYETTCNSVPQEVPRPAASQPRLNPKRYWTRRELADWLVDELRNGPPTIVGIDHAFSFPIKYFEEYQLGRDWAAFLEDFHRHWPTDAENTYVDFVRNGSRGKCAERTGSAKWRRVTEVRVRAKSVFHFDVRGQVAKSTHAGLPWLLRIRRELGGRVHFWPFDGWQIPAAKSAIVEVYPSLWLKSVAHNEPTKDQRDAYVTAEWLRASDADGWLAGYLGPDLLPSELEIAAIEGWILGVGEAECERPRTTVP